MPETRTPLQIHIEKYEKKNYLRFNPTKEFYKQLGISYDSFWKIVKGMRKPYVEEIKLLSKFFNIPIEDFFK
jgi:hypothetical protein